MNKAEFMKTVSDKSGLTKIKVGLVLDAIEETILDCVQEQEPINLVGFGSFIVKNRAGHIGHDPRTHEEIQIKPHNVLVFRPGKNIKEVLNETRPSEE